MNKKLLKASLLIMIMIVAVVTLTGCSQNPLSNDNKTEELAGLTVYTANEDMDGYTKCSEVSGVEFYYPSNYVSVGKSTQPMYMDPDVLGVSVNLVYSEFSSIFTFEGYVDASITGLKNQMTIKGDVSKQYINLNGVKAAKLDYTATSSGQTLEVTQVLIVKDSKAYILTLGGPEGSTSSVQDKFDTMMKSFK